jgi:hypothetical protein
MIEERERADPPPPHRRQRTAHEGPAQIALRESMIVAAIVEEEDTEQTGSAAGVTLMRSS